MERNRQVRTKFFSFFYMAVRPERRFNERLYIIKQNTEELLEEKKE